MDVAPELPDTPALAETGADGDAARSCYWQASSGRYGLEHFAFLLTTPDGQAQSPPNRYSTPDGSAWPTNDFVGRIVNKSGNQFSVDSCLSAASCQPTLYHFALCDSLSCSATDSAAPITLPVPIDRRVRVVWHMDNDAPGWCPGLYWLAVYDAEPGAPQGNLLFLGSGGRQPDTTGSPSNPLNTLPFSVALKALACGGTARDASSAMGDDYAFVFSPKNGSGPSLQLATGESGTFEFTPSAGNAQRLFIHCLDAVQPAHTDDYWNWDFWATGEPVASTVDGGGNGG